MDGKVQREGASSGKRLTVTMEVDTLDCPICFEPLRPPIFQCSVGHFICSSCRGKHLDNKCHLCSTKTTFKRCFGMEHVVQSVKVPCSNAIYGCTKKVTYYQKEEHEKACAAWGCFCPVSCCTFLGPTEVLLDHLTTEHEIPSTTLPDSDTVSLRLQLGLHVLQRNMTNYFFLLRLSLLAVGHAISIICVQPSRTEPKFTCNMNYDCFATGFCESSSCHIRSSSLSDGLPTGFDLILPKGKISEDRNSIMLRITIQQALSVSRCSLQGNGPTPAPQRKTLFPKWLNVLMVRSMEVWALLLHIKCFMIDLIDYMPLRFDPAPVFQRFSVVLLSCLGFTVLLVWQLFQQCVFFLS